MLMNSVRFGNMLIVCACVRACVRACARACVSACVCVCVQEVEL